MNKRNQDKKANMTVKKRKPKLKLYVWENVLVDMYDGMMVALATSAEHARKVILRAQMKKDGYLSETMVKDLKQDPKVYSRSAGIVLWGGG